MKLLNIFLLVLTLCLSKHSHASPWIGTLEPQLHKDLVTLSEWGVVDAAVTSFPVPWKGIAQQLSKINAAELPAVPAIAAKRLQHYLNIHKTQKGQSILSLYAANDTSRFTDFSGQQAPNAQLNMTKEFYVGRWAGQLSVNHETRGEQHLDESFIAYQFGYWNLRLGSMSQWWGPGQSSSLILSNNARPIPSIALSRSQATRSENAWLRYLGPWFFTMQVGQLESSRDVPDARIWSTRFNFKPVSGLELGISWNAMWGGDGQGSSLSDLVDVISLRDICPPDNLTCDDSQKSPQGNHHAGFDISYTRVMFDRPISLYAQRIGENKRSHLHIIDAANLFGISSYILGNKIYLESSDTQVNCSSGVQASQNCFYENPIYTSGYRFYDRAIGSTFDSDSKMLALGLQRSYKNGDLLDIQLTQLELNPDGQLPSPILNGNTEDLVRLSGFYQTQYKGWLIKLGASVEKGDVDDQDETHGLIYTKLRYRLN